MKISVVSESNHANIGRKLVLEMCLLSVIVLPRFSEAVDSNSIREVRGFGPTTRYIRYLQKPTVEIEGSQHVKEGDPIKMTCLLDVADGVNFDMKWILPDSRLASNNSRITVSLPSSTPHPSRWHYQQGRLEMIINETVEVDTGFYECKVTDHNSNVNYKAVEIRVLKEADIGFIELYEDNKLPHINITSGRDVRIAVGYRSGLQLEFYWTKDTELLIVDEKYAFQKDSNTVMLTIKESTIFDTGVYTLHAANAKNYTNFSMKVFVREKPFVTMNPIYTRKNAVVTFVCTAIAYPRPTMRFAFIPCIGDPWRNCSQSLHKDSATKYGRRVEDSESQADIITVEEYAVRADMAGYVECYAKNGYGEDFVKADLLISDLDKPIVVNKVPPEGDVTIGDKVTIKCAAVVYNHTDQLQFFRDDDLLSESDDGILIESGYESYAYWRKLVIYNIGKEHEGLIRCMVPLMGTANPDSDEMSLVVHEPTAPKIMEGSDHVVLDLEIGERYTLTCKAEGMPKPTIQWVKNGEPVISNNDSIILLSDGSLRVQLLKPAHTGEYRCLAWNKINQTEKVWMLQFKTVSIHRTWVYISLSLFISSIIAIVLISIFYNRKKKEVETMKEAGLANFEEGNPEQINPEISLHEQADLLPYKIEYEFPIQRLKLGKQLGAGAFGVVMKATAAGIVANEDETVVAVKMVKKQTDNEVMRALISELKIMVHLGQHLNVVNLLGAVTKNIAKRDLMVIVEYCRFGSVENFLLKHRPYFIDQVNREPEGIDSTTVKMQCQRPTAPSLPHHRRTSYPTALIDCTSKARTAADTNPKNHMNSNGYVRHSGIQTIADFDSCCREDSRMTSVEDEVLNTADIHDSNDPVPVRSVTTTDLVCWASQVACGMEYLASRKVLHGDLAARNVLLCDDNVVKICDFGFARSMYRGANYKKKGDAPLPFKWLALECISDNVFSTQSDVWAYGIALWEFFSLARVPYPGMEANQQLYYKLRDGYRMDKPQYANQDIYDIMLKCWNVEPDSRPTFSDLKNWFNAMLSEVLRNYYIDLNKPYLAMNAEKETSGEPDYLSGRGPSKEQTPKGPPNFLQRIINPVPQNSGNPDYLQMTSVKANTEDRQFDKKPNSSLQWANEEQKKNGIPEEILMLNYQSYYTGH